MNIRETAKQRFATAAVTDSQEHEKHEEHEENFRASVAENREQDKLSVSGSGGLFGG